MSTLTPLQQFQRDGFYVARALLDAADVVAVRDALRRTFRDQLKQAGAATASEDIFTLMLALHDEDIVRYRKVVGALWHKIEVYNVLHSPRIQRVLTEDFGWDSLFVPGGQVVHVMADELKIPDGYFGLVPHQDYPSVQGSLDGVVVWMPLVDVDRDNYPLEVIPGSHLFGGILPSIENSDSTWEVTDPRCRDEDYVPAEVTVGDVIFMSGFTVHRSSKKGTRGRLRLAMSPRFDNAREPTFVERCYPSAYTRSVHREQYFGDFPSAVQVSNAILGK